MAIQEIGYGSSGPNFGVTLAEGLSNLAQTKIEQMQKKQRKEATKQQLKGFAPNASESTLEYLAGIQDPKQRNELLSNLLGNQPQQQEQQMGGLGALQQQGQPQQQEQPSQIGALQEQQGDQQAEQEFPFEMVSQKDKDLMKQELSSDPSLKNSFSPEVFQKLSQWLDVPADQDPLIQQGRQRLYQEAGVPMPQAQPQQQPEQMAPQAQPMQQAPVEQVAPQQAQATEAQRLFTKPMTAAERQKTVAAEQKLMQKEEAADRKETQKYYDQVLVEEKASKEADNRLNKMEKLVKKGSLPNSALYGALKNIEEHVSPAAGAAAGAAIGAAFGGIGALPGAAIGGALGGLISPFTSMLRSAQRVISPDTEEFEKLSSKFIAGAKAVFGARITDQDLKAYMAQIPTLSNTDAGKLKIIEGMKIANKADKVRAKAMKDIIKDNNGKRPNNLPILVEDMIADDLEKLALEFLKA